MVVDHVPSSDASVPDVLAQCRWAAGTESQHLDPGSTSHVSNVLLHVSLPDNIVTNFRTYHYRRILSRPSTPHTLQLDRAFRRFDRICESSV